MKLNSFWSVCRAWLVAAIFGLGGAGCYQPQSVTCPSGRVCPVGQKCAADKDTCISDSCGDGVKNGIEACDDGNKRDFDDCSSDCTTNYQCGNGMLDNHFPDPTKNEFCDDGDKNGMPGYCSLDCKTSGRCGNGFKDGDEECDYCVADDGVPDAAGSDAASNASDASGGGGDAAEAGMSIDGSDDGSDDGAGGAEGGTGADASGTGGAAGSGGAADAGTDGRPVTEEMCRLHIYDSRACNHNCTRAYCLDGIINQARHEECDDGRETPTCNRDCTKTRCGDGLVNREAKEECDVSGGVETAACNGSQAGAVACHFSACGDDHTNPLDGETCDENEGADTVHCNGSTAPKGVRCHPPACGDGYRNMAALEDCDVGAIDTAACNAGTPAANALGVGCHAPRCGDGYRNALANEDCDLGAADTLTCNGNSAAAVTADAACRPAGCGDGYKNSALNEQCDEKGGADSAACNGNGVDATRLKVACQNAVCGDGYLNPRTPEECDDKNTTPGDGCDANCKKEPGFNCTGTAPTICITACGDGFQSPQESCDDHNADKCGTCSASCGAVQAVAAAKGKIVAGASSNHGNGQLFTISDGLHPAVTFEFNRNATVGQGHVRVAISSSTDAGQVADRIRAAINGVGLELAVTATNGTAIGELILTNDYLGSAGNVDISTTATLAGFVDGMKGGLGRDCGATLGCNIGDDCASGLCCTGTTPAGVACTAHTCLPSSCDDKVRNGLETDSDCGGPCAACGTGKGCIGGADCASGVCSGGLCQDPSCGDGVQNGGESDQDCGSVCAGTACPASRGGICACADTLACGVDADCQSGVCTSGVCARASCGDGVKNGNESDNDCGSACAGAACPVSRGGICACADNQLCKAAADCQSGVCGTSGTCKTPTCGDGVKNGHESDNDCGSACAGAACPASRGGVCACPDNQNCRVAADCQSGVCGSSGTCRAPACNDGIKNGSETGQDCGGSCLDCPGDPCTNNNTCKSNQCPSAVDGGPRVCL
jgi:cysteine-rich repeat protein